MPNTAKRRGAAWPLKSNVIDPLAHLLQMGDFFIVCLFFIHGALHLLCCRQQFIGALWSERLSCKQLRV